MIKVVGFPNSSGSSYWRLVDPFKYLNSTGKYQCVVSNEGITDEIAAWADIYVLKGTIDKQGIATLHAYQQEKGKKIVLDQDDRIEVDEESPHKIDHDRYQAQQIIEILAGISDMITTTTPYLKSALKKYNSNIKVLPNYMDMNRWDLPKLPQMKNKLRIGWAGSLTHMADLALVSAPIKKVLREFPETQLVIMGDSRIADMFSGYDVEYVPGVPFDEYPSRLHGLRLDIGIAPLKVTPFNKCKSNIKYLEYGIAKVPSVCSHIVYGKRNLDTRKRAIVAQSPTQWYLALRNLVVSKNLRQDIRLSAYTHVRQQYDLKNHIYKWDQAYSSLTVSPKSHKR